MKTKKKIKLTAAGGLFSRSKARRLSKGLEKFKIIELDFADVTEVGQGFADEIFRVFPSQYPGLEITYINANSMTEFMIQRALKTNQSSL